MKAIKLRFQSFEANVYKSIAAISDHKRWDYDNPANGVKQIHKIYDHFKIPLDENNFDNDLAVKEFRDIKRIVQRRYRHLNANQMWESIITAHPSQRNIILVAQLILSIEWESSTVEQGFSTTGRMLTPSRKWLPKTRLSNLIMLRVNIPILKALDPQYEEN